MAVAEDSILLLAAAEEDIQVEEGHRAAEPLLEAVVEEDSHQKVGTDRRVAVVEARQIAIMGILVLAAGLHCCRVQRWIPSLDQSHFGNDPKYLCIETSACRSLNIVLEMIIDKQTTKHHLRSSYAVGRRTN